MKANSTTQTIEDLFDALKNAEQIVSAIGCPPLTSTLEIQTLFLANKLGHQVAYDCLGHQTVTADGLSCKYLFYNGNSTTQPRFQFNSAVSNKEGVDRIISKFEETEGGVYFAFCNGIVNFSPFAIKASSKNIIDEIKRQTVKIRGARPECKKQYRVNVCIGKRFLKKFGKEIKFEN